MPYKAGIIGCGNIAGLERIEYTHAEAYRRHPETELVAAYDVDSEREKQFIKKWNIPQIPLGELDIVSICTPDEAHIDCLKLCLNLPNVKSVWCEKPICRDYEQAIDIARRYRDAGKRLCVNYQRRWAPKFQIPRKEIKSIAIDYTKSFWHNGCHAVDLVLYLLGCYDPAVAELTMLDSSEFRFEVKVNGETVALNEWYDFYPVLDNIVNGKWLRSDGFSAALTTKVCQKLMGEI